jgi:hypothetical protein
LSGLRAGLGRRLQGTVGSRLVLAPAAAAGYRRYRRTGATPPLAYAAMRKLFGSTQPQLFDALVERAAAESGPLPALDAPVDGLVPAAVVDDAVRSLCTDGVAVLPDRLPDDLCAGLESVALEATCTMIGRPVRARFDPEAPQAVRYDVDEADLLASHAVQRLLADRSLLALAQRYLGTAPVHDLVAMWWSAPAPGGPSSAAAQLFHFDLDRLRFLKLFVYLTDVDDSTGPHQFVAGSHRHLPTEFRHDRRYDTDEVRAAFGDAAIRTIGGPRGTVFVADTRGLHRGCPVELGHRLVFQMEWASSLFGIPTATLPVPHPVPELAAAVAELPTVYRRLRLEP